MESIPENLTYPAGSPSHVSIFDTWMSLIRSSKHSIDIASFYWSLRGSDVWHDPSDWQVVLSLLPSSYDVKLFYDHGSSCDMLWTS